MSDKLILSDIIVVQCSRTTTMLPFWSFAITVAIVGVLCLAWMGVGALMAG
jgi:hypothetical protein